MMRFKIKRAAAYFKSRLIHFLLLAVVLTSGFSINYAAQAKYASYLGDFSSAVAGDFCFFSDYLGEQNSHTEYNIGSWNGKSYEITLEIRNFFNSLRYNRSGENFYYYVTAEVYKESTDGQLIRDEENLNKAFTTTVTYGSDATYKYGTLDCAYLPGMDVFDHESGTQEVKVKVAADNAVSEKQFLVVQAHTVPNSEVEKISGAAPTPGVFDITLESVFVLNMASTQVEIQHNLAQSETDYTVICKLICGNISGGIMSIIRVYFNSEKLDPDVNLGEVYEDQDGTYIKVPMYSESIKNCFFFKKRMDVTVEDNTDVFIRLEDGEVQNQGNDGATGGEDQPGGGTDTDNITSPDNTTAPDNTTSPDNTTAPDNTSPELPADHENTQQQQDVTGDGNNDDTAGV